MLTRESQQARTAKPKFFYGYIIVLAAFVVMTLTFGINFTFGVFFEPLINEFGWSRGVTSAVYSFLTMVAGFWGIFAGKISDRLGPRTVAIFGGVCIGVGFLLMSRVTALWQMFLYEGLLVAIGIGGSWPILLATVAKWFVARRGLMTGIVAAGIGCGTVITPPVATWLISALDWRWAYIIVGTGTMALIIIASLFLKRDPSKMGLLPHGVNEMDRVADTRGFSFGQALSTTQFWMVCGVYFCFGYCLHTVMIHIVPYSTGMGISPGTASGILAIIGVVSIVIRFLTGYTADRVGVRICLLVSLIGLIVALAWLRMTGDLWGLFLFGVLFGIANGGPMTIQSLLLAELFGLSSLGVIVGGAAFIYTIGSAIGPTVAGYIFDITGSYNLAFIICAGVAAIATTLTLLLKPIKRREQAEDRDLNPAVRG